METEYFVKERRRLVGRNVFDTYIARKGNLDGETLRVATFYEKITADAYCAMMNYTVSVMKAKNTNEPVAEAV